MVGVSRYAVYRYSGNDSYKNIIERQDIQVPNDIENSFKLRYRFRVAVSDKRDSGIVLCGNSSQMVFVDTDRCFRNIGSCVYSYIYDLLAGIIRGMILNH